MTPRESPASGGASLTGEDLVGVGRTEVQGENSRDAGTVQTLRDGGGCQINATSKKIHARSKKTNATSKKINAGSKKINVVSKKTVGCCTESPICHLSTLRSSTEGPGGFFEPPTVSQHSPRAKQPAGIC